MSKHKRTRVQRHSVASGEVYGNLTVLSDANVPERLVEKKNDLETRLNHRCAICECACGELLVCRIAYLKNGSLKSCRTCSADNKLRETYKEEYDSLVGKKIPGTQITVESMQHGEMSVIATLRCSCGQPLRPASVARILGGTYKTTMCLSCANRDAKHIQPIDEIGNVYGHLTVVKRVGSYWQCKCVCGNITFAGGTQLRRGMKRSCGCRGRKKAAVVV